MKLLRSVVQSYPGRNIDGEKIVMTYPFEMLAHYYRDLLAIKVGGVNVSQELTSEDLAEEERQILITASNLDRAMIYDLDVLLKFFASLHQALCPRRCQVSLQGFFLQVTLVPIQTRREHVCENGRKSCRIHL